MLQKHLLTQTDDKIYCMASRAYITVDKQNTKANFCFADLISVYFYKNYKGFSIKLLRLQGCRCNQLQRIRMDCGKDEDRKKPGIFTSKDII